MRHLKSLDLKSLGSSHLVSHLASSGFCVFEILFENRVGRKPIYLASRAILIALSSRFAENAMDKK
jgi:hypothetical protein